MVINVSSVPAGALHALLEGADEGGAGGARRQLGRLPLLLLDLGERDNMIKYHLYERASAC